MSQPTYPPPHASGNPGSGSGDDRTDPPSSGASPWPGQPPAGGQQQPAYGSQQPSYGQQSPYGSQQPPYGQQPAYGSPSSYGSGQQSYGSQQQGYGTPASYGRAPTQPQQGGYPQQQSGSQPSAYPQQPGYPQQGGYGQQPPYGPGGQPWGPPGGAPPKKSSTMLIALIVAGVLVVAGIGAALWFGLRADDSGTSTGTTTGTEVGGIPAATQQPIGLGTDPAMDAYAQDCYDGDMGACDDLFRESPIDSAYETYGGTCAGRQSVELSDQVFCVDAFSGD